jgi:hypothetical protein
MTAAPGTPRRDAPNKGREASDAPLDDLFAGPLEGFTSARNALARRFREEGRRAEADEVKALRKPSLAAWAVNQLSRHHKADITELLETSARLRAVQTEALSGTGAPDDLRTLARSRRDLVARLTERAEHILSEAGGGAARTHVERVSATLLAAGEDEQVAREVLQGRLSEHRAPTGFEGAFAGLPAVAVEEDVDRARHRREARGRARALAEAAEAAHRDASRLEREAEAAEAAAERARRAAERARAHAESLRSQAVDAAGNLDR